LERWKSIYPRYSQSLSSDDSHSSVSVSGIVDQHSPESNSLPGLPAEQTGGEVDNCGLQGRVINTSLLSNHIQPPTLQSGIENSGAHLPTLASLIPSSVPVAGYLPSADMPSSFALMPKATAILAQTDSNVQPLENSQPLLTPLNVSEFVQRPESGIVESHLLPTYAEAVQARTLTLLATTPPLFGSQDASRATVDKRFVHQSQLSQAETVPAGWSYVGGRRADESKMGELTPLHVVQQISTPGGGGDPVTSRQVVANGDAGSISDDLRVITSRLMKSHVEDLTLQHTPRGSGAGYGVGCYDLLPSPFTANLPSSEPLTGQER